LKFSYEGATALSATGENLGGPPGPSGEVPATDTVFPGLYLVIGKDRKDRLFKLYSIV